MSFAHFYPKIVHCLKIAFRNQPFLSFLSPLLSFTLQPGLKRTHDLLALQKTRRYAEKQKEDGREASDSIMILQFRTKMTWLVRCKQRHAEENPEAV